MTPPQPPEPSAETIINRRCAKCHLTVGAVCVSSSSNADEVYHEECFPYPHLEPSAETKLLPPVLDVCCGPKMMWFDRADKRALFVDKRRETHLAADCSVKNGERQIVVDPDIIADFTNLPFPDDSFALVVFDPPHISRQGSTSWLLKKYGTLIGDWRDMLRHGFEQCFRVLKPDGTLVFKWSETQIPVSEILDLTNEIPLFGQRCGKSSKTHWLVFMKPNTRVESDELKRLRADEQRFRAALVKIMDCGWSQREAYEIAKAAIEGTK